MHPGQKKSEEMPQGGTSHNRTAFPVTGIDTWNESCTIKGGTSCIADSCVVSNPRWQLSGACSPKNRTQKRQHANFIAHLVLVAVPLLGITALRDSVLFFLYHLRRLLDQLANGLFCERMLVYHSCAEVQLHSTNCKHNVYRKKVYICRRRAESKQTNAAEMQNLNCDWTCTQEPWAAKPTVRWHQHDGVESPWWLVENAGEGHVSVDGEVADDQLLLILVRCVVRKDDPPADQVSHLNRLLRCTAEKTSKTLGLEDSKCLHALNLKKFYQLTFTRCPEPNEVLSEVCLRRRIVRTRCAQSNGRRGSAFVKRINQLNLKVIVACRRHTQQASILLGHENLPLRHINSSSLVCRHSCTLSHQRSQNMKMLNVPILKRQWSFQCWLTSIEAVGCLYGVCVPVLWVNRDDVVFHVQDRAFRSAPVLQICLKQSASKHLIWKTNRGVNLEALSVNRVRHTLHSMAHQIEEWRCGDAVLPQHSDCHVAAVSTKRDRWKEVFVFSQSQVSSPDRLVVFVEQCHWHFSLKHFDFQTNCVSCGSKDTNRLSHQQSKAAPSWRRWHFQGQPPKWAMK